MAAVLYHGLTGRVLPPVAASVLLSVLSLALLWYGRYMVVPLAAAGAVVCILRA